MRLGDSSVTETHTGQDDQGASRTGTVTVSQTKDLATRQVVDISWTGFMPTVNAPAPAASTRHRRRHRVGYPVMLMECQGDDPTP